MKLKTNLIRKIITGIFIVSATSIVLSTPATKPQPSPINNTNSLTEQLKNNDLKSFKDNISNEETYIKRSQNSMYSIVI